MKKYKLIKDLPGLIKGEEFIYSDIKFSKGYLLLEGFIEEIKEDNVENLLNDIIVDFCVESKREDYKKILKQYIKDNGKEEVIEKAFKISSGTFIIDEFKEFLEDYIIIKI